MLCADSRISLIPMVAPRIVEALSHPSRKLAQTRLLGYEKNQWSAELGRLPGRVAKTTLRINRDSSRTGVSDIAHQRSLDTLTTSLRHLTMEVASRILLKGLSIARNMYTTNSSAVDSYGQDANRRLNRNEILRPTEDHCASA